MSFSAFQIVIIVDGSSVRLVYEMVTLPITAMRFRQTVTMPITAMPFVSESHLSDLLFVTVISAVAFFESLVVVELVQFTFLMIQNSIDLCFFGSMGR